MTSKKSEACALCKIFSSGNLLYVHESENLICNSHHLYDDIWNTEADRDHLIPYVENIDAKSITQTRRSRSELTITTKDRFKEKQHSGGDGDKKTISLKKSASKDKLKNEIKLKTVQNNTHIPSPKQSTKSKNETEIAKRKSANNCEEKDSFDLTVVYRNMNFKESSGSIISKSSVSEDYKTVKCFYFEESTASAEGEMPVQCPITECSKMLATNSIFSHFHFEHSKIPIINLEYSVKIPVKINRITSENRCIAVLLSPATNVSGNNDETNTFNNETTYPLLLMGVRKSYHICDLKPGTEYIEQQAVGGEMKINREKNENEKHNELRDDAIMLWLCSTTNEDATYMITITSENNKFSRNYIGPAFNLKEQEMPVYLLAESLVIQNAALNRFCDKEGHLNIVVQIVTD